MRIKRDNERKIFKTLIAIEWKILLIIMTVNNDNNSVRNSHFSLAAGTWGTHFDPGVCGKSSSALKM